MWEQNRSQMKKFIVVIQKSAFRFEKLILEANCQKDLYPMYRDLGMTYSINEYSVHANKMADLTVNQLNSL